jgi:hypothetical protein
LEQVRQRLLVRIRPLFFIFIFRKINEFEFHRRVSFYEPEADVIKTLDNKYYGSSTQA